MQHPSEQYFLSFIQSDEILVPFSPEVTFPTLLGTACSVKLCDSPGPQTSLPLPMDGPSSSWFSTACVGVFLVGYTAVLNLALEG